MKWNKSFFWSKDKNKVTQYYNYTQFFKGNANHFSGLILFPPGSQGPADYHKVNKSKRKIIVCAY